MSIENDTCIAPLIVADCVIQEVVAIFADKEAMHTHPDLTALSGQRDAVAEMLERKAENIYSADNHKQFTKRIRSSGNNGRDWLYAFMRHWLSDVIFYRYKGLWTYLPEGFKIGQR